MMDTAASRFTVVVAMAMVAGCASSASRSQQQANKDKSPRSVQHGTAEGDSEWANGKIELASFNPALPAAIEPPRNQPHRLPPVDHDVSLLSLEQLAIDQNPRLRRLNHEYQAAAARSRYVDKLPDPRLATNVFGDPIETAAGSQRANLNLSQVIPWLARLDAEQQRACFEALAIRAEYAAERLRVLAAVRTGWYRLYVIDRQIETSEANQSLLESLIDLANARIAAAKGTQGDVLLGSLELSQLEERLLLYRRQRQAVEAEINRLVAQPAETPIRSPSVLDVGVPALTASEVLRIARDSQPEIQAAQLRVQASRWGIEVARLNRRPEFMVMASYFFTDDNRLPNPIVNVGEDPWAVGAQLSIPIWHTKYDALRSEAIWRHQAAHESVEELLNRYESLIVDLYAEARRAAAAASLYQSTILPQAEQTLAADKSGYTNGAVEFDRVIRDQRSLLMLQLSYQTALGELAMANAQLEQAAGQELAESPLSHSGMNID